MMSTSATWNFLLWVLFWCIVALALWWGVQEIGKWLQQNANGRADIRDFPDEARGEPGPQKPAATGGARHDAVGPKQKATPSP